MGTMTPRHTPRTLTRRPAPRPRRPFLEALEAYGVRDYVPETTTLTHTHDGVILEVMATGPDGDLLFHEDQGGAVDIVTVRRFYPHPTGVTR